MVHRADHDKLTTLVLCGLALLLASGCGGSYRNVTSQASSLSSSSGGSGGGSSTSLSASAQVSQLQPGGITYVTATGGTAPYTFRIVSGGGNINSSSGMFTAPSANTTVQIQVTDSAGTSTYAYLSVVSVLTLNLSSSTITIDGTVTMSTTGGTSPYTYTVLSGGGSVSGSTYTAPAYAGTATIQVSDSSGLTTTGRITIAVPGALSVSPATASLDIYGSQVMTVSGGVAPYTYQLISGAGTISGSTYVGPSTYTTARILVSDSNGSSVTVTYTVQNQTMVSTCQNMVVADATGVTRAGAVITLAGQQVCDVPISTSNMGTASVGCPGGWNAVTSGGVPYTVTVPSSVLEQTSGGVFYGSLYQTDYTNSHGSLAATPIEYLTVCTNRPDFFDSNCSTWTTVYAKVVWIACTM